MGYQAWFQCIKCNETYPLTEMVYECGECGGLLSVQHDMTELRKRPGAAWRELFDRRYMRNDFPYGSSVWGKQEMVCPEVVLRQR